MTARRAGWVAGGLLFVVYVATLAPSVTFWDAGEFIAAARVLGIPHPPGTPLFVVMLNSWARLFPFLPFAQATNLLSAACTAAALGLAGTWIARATGDAWSGLAGAIAAGAMSSVWMNATETEVYAASLLLSMAAIASADRAGRTGERRWLVLTAYLLALALPLHLSALVAAPAVIILATDRPGGPRDWSAGCALLGVATLAAGISRLSIVVTAIGVLLIALCAFLRTRDERERALTPVAILAVACVATSALLILIVRARYDPAINQGNPRTLATLGAVIGRTQYDVAGLWPRRAPVWLQLANWFEYADWQFALSLAPTVIPNAARVIATLIFAALGLYGAQSHRAADVRTWRALLVVFIAGSLGVIAYVNFRAGATFGMQFVPDSADHEARDRDYFFVLAFVAWGLWAGMGAVRLARQCRLPVAGGLAVAALPIALNWSAVDRRSEPEASVPRQFAAEALDSLPARAVLFVGGDNDTYPLWFAQQVESRRKDISIVTLPLLEADWYVDEIDRRNAFPQVGAERGMAAARRIAAGARAAGRPVAVTLAVDIEDRAALGRWWTLRGVVAVADTGSIERVDGDSTQMMVNLAATRAAALSIDGWLRGRAIRPSTDGTNEYMLGLLMCPRLILAEGRSTAAADSLASTCNYR